MLRGLLYILDIETEYHQNRPYFYVNIIFLKTQYHLNFLVVY